MSIWRAGGGRGSGSPHVLGRRGRGVLFLSPLLFDTQSSRVRILTGLPSDLLRPPGWGTSFSFRRHRDIGQISAVSLQFPSWWADDGDDTPATPVCSCLGTLRHWTGERKLQSRCFDLILLSDSCRRTGSKNYSLTFSK